MDEGLKIIIGADNTDLKAKMYDIDVQINGLKARLKELQAASGEAFNWSRLQGYNAKIQETQGEITRLTNTGKEGFDAMGNKIKDTSAFIDRVFMRVLLRLASTLVITFGVDALINFGKESIGLAAKAEGIQKAFEKLNQPDLLDNLRTATKGTVSDLQLMQSAVMASDYQVPLDKLADLFAFVRQRARDTGQEVTTLMTSIIQGIGEHSTKMLHDLGISSSQVQDEMKRTGSFAAAVTAIATEELKKQGDTALLVSDHMAQFSATWANLKVKLGDYILGIKDVTEANHENAISAHEDASQAQGLLEEYNKLTESGIKPTIEQKSRLKDITGQLGVILGDSVISINKETGALQLNLDATKKLIAQKILLSDTDAAKSAFTILNAHENENTLRSQIKLQQDLKDAATKMNGGETVGEIQQKQSASGSGGPSAYQLTPGEQRLIDIQTKLESLNTALGETTDKSNAALANLEKIYGVDRQTIQQMIPGLATTISPAKTDNSNTLEGLKQELKMYQGLRDTAVIGTKAFIEAQQEVEKLTAKINLLEDKPVKGALRLLTKQKEEAKALEAAYGKMVGMMEVYEKKVKNQLATIDPGQKSMVNAPGYKSNPALESVTETLNDYDKQFGGKKQGALQSQMFAQFKNIDWKALTAEQADAINQWVKLQGVFQAALQKSVSIVKEGLTRAFDDFFTKMLSGSKDAFSSLLKGLQEIIVKLIATAIQAKITAVVMALVNPVGAVAGVAAAIGIAGSLTGLADGGVVSGPTMAMVGEYPGASSNPEVIAPLDKLQTVMSNQGGGTLEARVSGNDLVVLMNRSSTRINRVQ